jgi:hypothetical protein
MQGIVSLLDDSSAMAVQSLWRDLERNFGLKGIHAAQFPHISYHVAQSYDTVLVEPALAERVRRLRPLHVRTAGLGLFNGDDPVLVVPVVRSPTLDRLHAAVCSTVDPLAIAANRYYDRHQWLPHISLAVNDLRPEKVPGGDRTSPGAQLHLGNQDQQYRPG